MSLAGCLVRRDGRRSSVAPADSNMSNMKFLWVAATQTAKLTKKQIDINIAERIALLLDMGSRGRSVHMDFVFGSLTVYSTVVKGVCVVYARQVESLIRDCEIVLVKRVGSAFSGRTSGEIAPFGVPTPSRSRSSTASRKSSLVRRESNVSAITIDRRLSSPLETVGGMDLDAICDDLLLGNNVSVPTPNGFPVAPVDSLFNKRIPRGSKRPRSGSSLDDSVSATEDAPVFDAIDEPAADFHLPLELPSFRDSIVEIATTARRTRRASTTKFRGYQPKVAYTCLQWASVIRAAEGKLVDVKSRTPLFFALHGSGPEREYSPVEDDIEDVVSVAQAVDEDDFGNNDFAESPLNESTLDELRAASVGGPRLSEDMDGRRSTLASSRNNSVNRQSIVSSVFGERHERDSRYLSFGSLADWGRNSEGGKGHSLGVRHPSKACSSISSVIASELTSRNKRLTTILSFSEICKKGVSSRCSAAGTFYQLLCLASAGEVKIHSNWQKPRFVNDELLFCLKDLSDCSSSSGGEV